MSALTPSQEFDQSPTAAPAPPTVLFDALSRMISHEVRNLLTPARAAAQMALDDPSDVEQLVAALQRTILACDRVTAITDAILERGSESPQKVTLSDALADALASCLPEQGREQIKIDGDSEVSLVTSAAHLRHILVNLITNALRASRMAGSVRIAFERSTWNNQGGATIVISDSGAGLPMETIRSLNAAGRRLQFPTSTGGRDALGVGLHVVRRLAADIGAELAATNTAAGGAEIRLFIPDLPIRLANAA